MNYVLYTLIKKNEQMNSFLETAAYRICDKQHYEIHYLKPCLSIDTNNFTSINLKVEKLVVSPKTFSISARLDSNQEKSLMDMYGIDATEITKSALTNEKISLLEKSLLNTYKSEGEKNLNLLNIVEKKNFLRRILEKMGVKFSTYIENENDLSRHIMKIAYVIYNTDKIGPANFAIISPNLSRLIRGEFFTFSNFPEVNRINLVEEFARFANLKIFVDNISKGNSITVGRETKENSAGVHIIDFGESFDRDANDKIVLEIKTSQEVIPGNTYISENVIIGKKPWIKKILSL